MFPFALRRDPPPPKFMSRKAAGGKPRGGVEAKIALLFYAHPSSPPQFEGIWPSPPQPLSFSSFWWRLHGNVIQRPAFWGATFAWLGSPRDAGAVFRWSRAARAQSHWSARFPGVCPGHRGHRRGSGLFGHIAGLWGGEGAPSGK